MINGIAMKGRIIIILFLLQRQIIEKLDSNHMSIDRMKCLVRGQHTG